MEEIFNMKFYDIEWLADKCGTDNKYEITAKIAAEARRESEVALSDFNNRDRDNPIDERFISNVLAEIEQGKSSINAMKIEDLPISEAEKK